MDVAPPAEHFCPTVGCPFNAQALGANYASCDHFGPAKCRFWNCGVGACSVAMMKHEQEECPWHAEARRIANVEHERELRRAQKAKQPKQPKRCRNEMLQDAIASGSAADAAMVPKRRAPQPRDEGVFDSSQQISRPFNAPVTAGVRVKNYYHPQVGETVAAVDGGWMVRWLHGGPDTKVTTANLYLVEEKTKM